MNANDKCTLVSREKALAILADLDALDSYSPGQSYYLVTNEAGGETLVGYGEDEPCATNHSSTSWHSPGYPSLPRIGDADWIADEMDRIEAEFGGELEDLNAAGGATLRQRALRLVTSKGDAPIGDDGKLVAAILASR